MHAGKYRDLWASVLFLATVAGVCGLAAFGEPSLQLTSTPSTSSDQSTVSFPLFDAVYLLLYEVLVGTILTVWLGVLIFRWPTFAMHFILLFPILCVAVLSIVIVIRGASLVWLFLTLADMVVLGAVYWGARERIPLSASIVKQSIDVSKKYPSVFWLALVHLLLSLVWIGVWATSLTGIQVKLFSPLGGGGAKLTSTTFPKGLLYSFFTLSAYWVAQVIGSVVFVTVAGLYGTFYFQGVHNPRTGKIQLEVANPVLQSLKRALTTSFGTVCFASLVVPWIRFLRASGKKARDSALKGSNVFPCCAATCFLCLTSIIGDYVEWLNGYALVHVAIFGKSFCAAARDTSELMDARGLHTAVNDMVVNTVLTIGALFVGGITAIIGGSYAGLSARIQYNWVAWTGNPNGASEVVALSIVIGLLVGLTIFGIVSSLVSACVTATFVCLAREPQVLAKSKPIYTQLIQQTYTDVTLWS